MYEIPENKNDVVRQDVVELFAAVLYKRKHFDYSTDGLWKDTMSFSSRWDQGNGKHDPQAFVRFTADEKREALELLKHKGYHLLKSVWYSNVNSHRLWECSLYEVKPAEELGREDCWEF